MSEITSLLALENLRFRWPDDQRDTLTIPKLELAKGARVFLKGQSGSGKTTLLSLLAGINTPNSGRIIVLGEELNALKASQRDQFRADHIGFIFQLFNLIPYLSVIENVTLACKFSSRRNKRAIQKSGSLKAEALRLLKLLQLEDVAINKRAMAELSVGQQQRVAAARALIGAPDLIIADEPTSALDTETREHFLKLLVQECDQSGSSILFVSHDGALEKHFDRVIYLEDINALDTQPKLGVKQ
jgi:putative ABC transport system ATP-binding protein